MNQRTQPLGMGIWIAIGFVVVLALMVALGATGLRYVAEANQRLKEIAQSNNIKTEFATLMHSALRERALSMHALPILADPFDKDAEIQRFNTQGAIYEGARERLERMSLNHEEKRILAHILELTREAQPEVQAVVEMAVFNDNQQEISSACAAWRCPGSAPLRNRSASCLSCSANRRLPQCATQKPHMSTCAT